LLFPLRDDRNRPGFYPLAVVLLISGNVAVFVYEMTLLYHGGEARLQGFITGFGIIPAEAVRGEDLHALLTSMFLHAGVWHLGGNMLFLWIFGDNVEDLLGGFRFLIFYLICGLAAAGTDIFMRVHSAVPAIGASGAISGILGAYIWSFPRNNVITFYWFWWRIGTLRIPAWIYLGFWFGFQLLSGTSQHGMGGGGVAYGAHIGGFIAGVLLISFFPKREAAARYYRKRFKKGVNS